MSMYIIAGVAGWVVAQGIKAVLHYSPKKSSDTNLQGLYMSGGMPSAHAATITAVTAVIAYKDGINSGLFGLALMVAGIVMYDAIMVRRSSGIQGELLTKLIKSNKKDITVPIFAKGHTPVEVLIGALIGALIGTVVFFATI